jgi:glycosyltransferase involved in cell wall biosynthesis
LLLAGENWSRFDFAVLRRLKAESGLRIVAVLQDMIPFVHPQFFESAAFVERFAAYVDFLARDADLVLAISNSTRSDFLEAAPQTDPARVVVVRLGADPIPSAEQSRPTALAALGERPFVLSVSTIQARKNFDLLYRLWQKSAIAGRDGMPHLVIVGREGFGSADLLHSMRNDPWIAKTVTILSTASDAELAWLYEHCAFTLYPSWYEGWGLPLSESLAYGKTFIASDNSSLPEAGQGLGIHVDPYDQIAWSREILRLTDDVEARRAMERRILAERKLPSWADCAHAIAFEIGRLTASGDRPSAG